MATTFGETAVNGSGPNSGQRNGKKKRKSDVPRRSTRRPELLVGVVLVVVCVLAGLWLLNRNSSTSPFVAVGSDIARGDVIRVEDLQIVDIASTDSLNVVRENELDGLVGRVAVTDLRKGTLLTQEHVSGSSEIAEGQAKVGMTLKPGNVPSISMQPGMIVEVLLTPVAGDAEALQGQQSERLLAARDDVLVTSEVVEVSSIGTQGDIFVALEMGENEAVLVGQAVSLGRVRLIEVGGQS